MLELREIRAGYGEGTVLRDVSLRLGDSEIVTLIGNNGAGKTTTVGSIMGWVDLTSGDIRIDDQSIVGSPMQDRAKMGVAVVPEEGGIFPRMTVLENLYLGAYLDSDSMRDERLERVYELFPRLGERKSQKAQTLSGGERQMLKIGLALMGEPNILLVDEPTLGLAPQLADNIIEEIRKINDLGVSILLVEQNLTKALEIADRAYVMENGKIIEEGEAADIKDMDEIRKSYMGL